MRGAAGRDQQWALMEESDGETHSVSVCWNAGLISAVSALELAIGVQMEMLSFQKSKQY